MRAGISSSRRIRWLGVSLVAGLAAWVWAGTVAGQTPDAATVVEALREGETRLQLRLRFENVGDDDVGPKEARALTLRTALAYETRRYRGWSFLVEAENVTAIGNDLYNNAGAGSLGNGVRDRPIVADPALTEINQALVSYRLEKTTLTLGRQEISLGDHRLVGNVGWRQNHQSFDAFLVKSEALKKTTFTYAFVDSVHRVFGDSKPMAGHLLRVDREVGSAGTLDLYGFRLDFDRAQDASQSRNTLGAEWKGELPARRAKVLYEVEAAWQSDTADNPRRIDIGYRHLALGVAWRGNTIQTGLEVLEGNSRDGQFSTPLATLHKFNGWADKFLATPVDGLEDLYLSVGGKAGALGWKAVYHRFEAESTASRYGDELDVELIYRTPWKQELGLKGAFYDADDLAADTNKWMLWTSYTF